MANWKKLSSKVVHRNPWWKVHVDQVIRPDGNKGTYYYTKTRVTPCIIAVDVNNKIWLTHQTRYPIGNISSWETINGTVDKGETPLHAAKRELKEETGVTAKKWTNLGSIYASNGVSNEKVIVFVAEKLEHGKNNLDPTEDIKITSLPPQRIKAMIKTGKICCGITIAALYKYSLYKNL